MSSYAPDVKRLVEQAIQSRPDGEPTDVFLKRALKRLVLAHTQAHVARSLGIKEVSVAKPLREDVSPQLGTICRIADAVGCELTLVAREA